jgi:hypothetical protein
MTNLIAEFILAIDNFLSKVELSMIELNENVL